MKAVNKSSSGCPNCMLLIRIIVLECLTWNVRLFIKYIKSKDNDFADVLSRHQNDRFWKLSKKHNKNFDVKPTQVPDNLWPLHKVWIGKCKHDNDNVDDDSFGNLTCFR